MSDEQLSPDLQSTELFAPSAPPPPMPLTAQPEICEVKAPHIVNGHTFVVSTVLPDIPIMTAESKVTTSDVGPNIDQKDEQMPTCSKYCHDSIDKNSPSTAVVPLSSSLPSKLLRFHAKRSAQALLRQVEHDTSSDEGLGVRAVNDCAEIYDDIDFSPTPPLSPQPQQLPPQQQMQAVAPAGAIEVQGGADGGYDDKVDGGVGSSIDGSEESEYDDELKPLAVDNHVLHDVPLNGSPIDHHMQSQDVDVADLNAASILTEENLEKLRKFNIAQSRNGVANIYLHPNFKQEATNSKPDMESSPPPAVAPANSPTNETTRAHRSFLAIKKLTEEIAEADKACSTVSLGTNSSDQVQVNEIDSLDPSLIPNEELAAEITEAVEYYFSNESILKDAFLLKHVRRNKEGFVSLKLVSSFKRIRQLTKDWRVVGHAVRQKSRKVELNEVGTKLRRIDPLPNFDETMPSRTIVACDLPLDKLTIEKVSDIFSKCGEIALIRILKPGMAIPVDVRQFMNKHPEMLQKECALVEFVESSSARDAKGLEGPFQVYDMVAPKKKTGKRAVGVPMVTPVTRMVEHYRFYNDPSFERTRGGSFSGMGIHESDLRHKLKRNNSEFYPKPYGAEGHPSHGHSSYNNFSPTHRGSLNSDHSGMHHFHHYQSSRASINHEQSSVSQAAMSPTNNMNFYSYSPRRYSNTSTISAGTAAHMDSPVGGGLNSGINNGPMTTNSSQQMHHSPPQRRLSNVSDNYVPYQEMGRRPSNCSENGGGGSQRRDSNCSENCPCTRRVSDFAQTEVYRKTSQGSIGSGERRFSNGSMTFERTFSNASDMSNGGHGNGGYSRRMSDFNYDRKQSIETQTPLTYDNDGGNVGGGGGGYNVFPRRYSNNFNSVAAKMAAYDNAQYINGRRMSTDSGYDRRYSFGSEFEGSPRSRTGSFLSNYKHGNDFDGSPRSRTNSFLDGSPRSRSGSLAQRNAENLVRTPMGPDGSKGFQSRVRKFGQTVSPV